MFDTDTVYGEKNSAPGLLRLNVNRSRKTAAINACDFVQHNSSAELR